MPPVSEEEVEAAFKTFVVEIAFTTYFEAMRAALEAAAKVRERRKQSAPGIDDIPCCGSENR